MRSNDMGNEALDITSGFAGRAGLSGGCAVPTSRSPAAKHLQTACARAAFRSASAVLSTCAWSIMSVTYNVMTCNDRT